MDEFSLGVLITAVVASTWLLFYVHIYLPKRLEERFYESIKAFGNAVELRFPSHKGMTERVHDLSQEIGRRMGLSRRELRELAMAARLRDIGLCAIPYGLVNGKEQKDWTIAERSTYDRHPEVSGAMLELVPSLRHVASIVRWHHADFDGSSRIDGPVGSHLPIQARILRVATDYVWLERSDGVAVARAEILALRGKAYCTDVVETFESMLTSTRVEQPQPSLV